MMKCGLLLRLPVHYCLVHCRQQGPCKHPHQCPLQILVKPCFAIFCNVFVQVDEQRSTISVLKWCLQKPAYTHHAYIHSCYMFHSWEMNSSKLTTHKILINYCKIWLLKISHFITSYVFYVYLGCMCIDIVSTFFMHLEWMIFQKCDLINKINGKQILNYILNCFS